MNKSLNNQVRVRFAPSPTGPLHIGGLRTALFNWLFARHHNGVFLIRIEDTDLERSKQEYTDSILSSFHWMEIVADEPIVIQSQRIVEHRNIIERLLDSGKAYRCYCSPEEIGQRAKKKIGVDELFVSYDRFCRERTFSEADKKKPSVVRFALPLDKTAIAFDDLVRGTISITMDQLDDFIIARSDGSPVYNFVVVADDAFMHITHVIRGEDHITNTFKQILLYEACGFPLPQFAHVPFILGPSGAPLSKRDAATSVLDYKQQGYLPDALFNYLVRLGWSHGDQEIFTKEEMILFFSFEHVGKKGAVFDMNKLQWVNGVYLRQKPEQELCTYAIDNVIPDLRKRLVGWSDEQCLQVIGFYKERVKTVLELAHELVLLHDGSTEYTADDLRAWTSPQTPETLRLIIQTLEGLPAFTVDLLSESIKSLSKTLNLKLVALAQPIRIALVGKSSSPGVFELLAFLGKKESVRRLQALCEALEKKE